MISQQKGFIIDKVSYIFILEVIFNLSKVVVINITRRLIIVLLFYLFYLFEFWMGFIFGIYEVLYLCHLELSDSYETVSWCDLVSEAQTDLSSCEWQSTTIELDEFVKVDEHALSGLWSEIAHLF